MTIVHMGTHTQEEVHVMIEAEIEVIQLQDQEWQAITRSWDVGMEHILPQNF